ncbi:redox-regulated ATPase YchF [candidate division KSB1 bacterium]
MKIGITGLSQSGKTTIFNALSGAHAATSEYYHRAEKVQHNISVVKVPDRRLDSLYDLMKTEKKINAAIEYVDVAGFIKSSDKSDLKSGEYFGHISKVDVLMVVIRGFKDENVIHPEGSIDPQRDFEMFNAEILFRDMEVIKNTLKRLNRSFIKKDDVQGKKEREILERCREKIEAEIPLRDVDFSIDEEKFLKGFQFLTQKPILIVLNIGEDEITAKNRIPDLFEKYIERKNVKGVSICGEIEMELSELEKDDAEVFMSEYRIDELATNKIINISYDLMGVISFFTFVNDETRAWTIKSGTKAKKAAGAIHSDIEKGFIRAEVIPIDQLLEHKSIHTCKEKGIMRLEGKDYIVQDGDVITFRFNV